MGRCVRACGERVSVPRDQLDVLDDECAALNIVKRCSLRPTTDLWSVSVCWSVRRRSNLWQYLTSHCFLQI